MTEGAPEPRKVVRRVVKRTVVRPVPTPDARARRPGAPTARVRARPPLPSIDLGAATARAFDAAGSRVSEVRRAATRSIGRSTRTVLDWRIPTVAPFAASIVTGVVCGVVVTASGGGLLAFFEWSRGTATGGGWWGTLSVAGLIVVCFALGAWLLRHFGSAQPRATSLLAVILALTGTLALVEPANGPWAGALMPLLIVASYVVAARLTDLVTRAETHY